MMKNNLLLILVLGCSTPEARVEKVIMISANAEWKVVKDVFPGEAIRRSPWGEYFIKEIRVGNAEEPVIFFMVDGGK